MDRLVNLRSKAPPSQFSFKPVRGLSWVYEHMGGVLLGSPQLERLKQSPLLFASPTPVVFDIENINPAASCDVAMANSISMYVRLLGTEILSTLAEPVVGQCKWRASFLISYSGSFAVLARLLHYNASGVFSSDLCPNMSEAEMRPGDKVEKIFAVDYDKHDDEMCCASCARIPRCSKFKRTDALCEYFAPLGAPAETKPRFPWQLGCGRNVVLGANVAACGSYVSPSLSLTASEDVVLGEWDNVLNVTVASTQSLLLKADARPACKVDSPHVRQGHWVRLAHHRVAHCRPASTKQFDHFLEQSQYPWPDNDDPLCWLVVSVPRFFSTANLDPVYTTHLADAFPPRGELAVEWRSLPTAPCSVPEPLSARALAQCIERKGLSYLEISGMSVMLSLHSLMRPYMAAALRKSRFKAAQIPVKGGRVRTGKAFVIPDATGNFSVFITNLAAPWLAFLSDGLMDVRISEMLEVNKARFASAQVKIWISPALTVWERRHFLHAARSQTLYARLRPPFVNAGFTELDFFALTAPFVFDLTPEKDTVHYQGPPLMQLAFLIMNAICED